MKNADVLALLCDALPLTLDDAVSLLALSGQTEAGEEQLSGEVSDATLSALLDGLIVSRRGPRKDGPAPALQPGERLLNNDVLKKVRIALDLREPALLELFAAGGRRLTKHELTPLFRKKGHKHYKRCDDDTLSAFFAGLSLRAPTES